MTVAVNQRRRLGLREAELVHLDLELPALRWPPFLGPAELGPRSVAALVVEARREDGLVIHRRVGEADARVPLEELRVVVYWRLRSPGRPVAILLSLDPTRDALAELVHVHRLVARPRHVALAIQDQHIARLLEDLTRLRSEHVALALLQLIWQRLEALLRQILLSGVPDLPLIPEHLLLVCHEPLWQICGLHLPGLLVPVAAVRDSSGSSECVVAEPVFPLVRDGQRRRTRLLGPHAVEPVGRHLHGLRECRLSVGHSEIGGRLVALE